MRLYMQTVTVISKIENTRGTFLFPLLVILMRIRPSGPNSSSLSKASLLEVADSICILEKRNLAEGKVAKLLKVIYHPLYGMNNYFLIWGDWLSCDSLRGSHDVTLWEGHIIANHTPYKETLVLHLVVTLIYLSQ